MPLGALVCPDFGAIGQPTLVVDDQRHQAVARGVEIDRVALQAHRDRRLALAGGEGGGLIRGGAQFGERHTQADMGRRGDDAPRAKPLDGRSGRFGMLAVRRLAAYATGGEAKKADQDALTNRRGDRPLFHLIPARAALGKAGIMSEEKSRFVRKKSHFYPKENSFSSEHNSSFPPPFFVV